MALTYWDMARRSGPESWRRIRHLRSSPIIASKSPSLRDSFTMSLQQAEQQFAAARAVGYESRPLNLFYGLSQAGRALAVAHEATDGQEGSEMQGHGLKCTNFPELAVDPVERFPQLGIRSQGNGRASFNKLTRLLSSEPLEKASDLGTLWGMLVEPQLHEPLTYPPHPVLLVQGDPEGPSAAGAGVLEFGSVPATVDVNDAPQFTAFTDYYPTLQGSRLARLSGGSGASGRQRESLSVAVSWQDQDPPKELSTTYSLYRGSKVVLPAPGPGRAVLHPLMTWWAVLFSLSMLARYEPRSWTRVIDVNNSPHAVPVEYLLDTALDSVPDIFANALGRVLGPDRSVE